MKRLFRKKSYRMMILLFLGMIASMLMSIYFCIKEMNKISNKNSKNDSAIIASMVKDSVSNLFLRPITVSETMSQDYSLRRYLKRSGSISAEDVEEDIANYLDSIKIGFGYNMVFAVCDESKAYYTYDGISKYVDIDDDEHDVWYKDFCESGKFYDLDVDTDEANGWALSVFVNTRICDEKGNFLGACGVGVEMDNLQELLREYEEVYNIKIDLVDETGLIQVDTDGTKIENEYLDNSYFEKIGRGVLFYEKRGDTSRVTTYMPDLDWYLVVEDKNPNKIDVMKVVTPSIIIFIVGFVIMATAFVVYSVHDIRNDETIDNKTKLSLTDNLTGLLNRRAYEDVCDDIRENGMKDYIYVALDVNGLKTVNDTIGHSAGDELLIGAVTVMTKAFSKFGKIYRTGGDEFVALLKCDEDEVKAAIKKLDELSLDWIGEQVKELAIAKGYVVCVDNADKSLDEIVDMADQLMYKNKAEYYEATGKKRRR